MKQQFYTPEVRHFTITKRHLAILLAIWWVLYQINTLIIMPSLKNLYKYLLQEGHLKIYDPQQMGIKQKSSSTNRKTHSEGKRNNQLSSKSKEYKMKSSNENSNQEQDNFEKQKLEKEKNSHGAHFEKGQEFRINFKITAKNDKEKKLIETQLKRKATEQSLRLAMESYLAHSQTNTGNVRQIQIQL